MTEAYHLILSCSLSPPHAQDVNMGTRAVLQVFERYQKERVTFVSAVAEIARSPQVTLLSHAVYLTKLVGNKAEETSAAECGSIATSGRHVPPAPLTAGQRPKVCALVP